MNVPSGYTALDLIGFTDRGDYDAQENYVKNDLVHYNGRVWLCLVDDTTEITPVAGANWKVWIDEAAYLSGLADVTISNPANGEAIRYNSQSGKWENVSVDSTPTPGSANLVQSGGVATQLANKANTADLATVATTGAYSDLSGTPPLAAVATSGAYSDLTGQPTIPTVNDATLTIQKNGTNVETFTANSSTNKTANITVPDVINDLSDVNISSVANEEILAYDSASSKWKNSGALGALKETFTNQINYNGAKNINGCKYNSRVTNGITFIVNDDGSITASGTAGNDAYGSINSYFIAPYTAQMIFSGGVNASAHVYMFDNTLNSRAYTDSSKTTAVSNSTGPNDNKPFYMEKGHSYTLTVRVSKNTVLSSPVTFYPMIRLASDTDPTYQPYAKTNQQLTKETTGLIDNVNNNGAKNYVPADLVTETKNGITVTRNSNSSYSVSGTRTITGAVLHRINDTTILLKANQRYTLSGGASDVVQVILRNEENSSWYTDADGNVVTSGATSQTFTNGNTDTYVNVCSRVSTNNTVNATVYPMLRLASDPDDTYVPYAMTNRQLTNAVEEINSQLGSIDYEGAGAHNSIYRGKYLGMEVTAEQYTAISSGKFTDLYIGDYWTIGGVNYRIAAFDYWYNTGDTLCTTHHVLLVPDSNLTTGMMNNTNTTSGGYAGSDFKTGANDNTALATVRNTIISAFGSVHILTHREYFTNTVAAGKPSAGAWSDSDVDLMNENMVYGTNIFLPHSDGSSIPNLVTIDKSQLNLFRYRPDLIGNTKNWWLRDIISDKQFAMTNSAGCANSYNAASTLNFRPAFAIKG